MNILVGSRSVKILETMKLSQIWNYASILQNVVVYMCSVYETLNLLQRSDTSSDRAGRDDQRY